jgi:hypothetical protein
MLKERGRELPQSGAADGTNASRVLGEIRGAADADALIRDDAARQFDAKQLLAAAVALTTEQVLLATPQKRVADMIEKAAANLGSGASAEQMAYLTNHIKGFARDAAEFLMRGDFGGLEAAISAFWRAARDADKIGPPRPAPMMPASEHLQRGLGWSSKEADGLQQILLTGIAGVAKGDRVVKADEEGVTLASGKTLSREQIVRATRPWEFKQ